MTQSTNFKDRLQAIISTIPTTTEIVDKELVEFYEILELLILEEVEFWKKDLKRIPERVVFNTNSKFVDDVLHRYPKLTPEIINKLKVDYQGIAKITVGKNWLQGPHLSVDLSPLVKGK